MKTVDQIDIYKVLMDVNLINRLHHPNSLIAPSIIRWSACLC